jgi:hypothetical protein
VRSQLFHVLAPQCFRPQRNTEAPAIGSRARWYTLSWRSARGIHSDGRQRGIARGSTPRVIGRNGSSSRCVHMPGQRHARDERCSRRGGYWCHY